MSFLIGHHRVEWQKRPRQKSLRLRYVRGSFIVSSSVRIPEVVVERFLLQHCTWLDTVIEKQSKATQGLLSKATKTECSARKRSVLEWLYQQVTPLADVMGVRVAAIHVRCNSRVWGSCSKGGVLRFHYQIQDLPKELAHYLLVHELAHIRVPNHSMRFWNVVAEYCPSYRELRKALRKIS